jgi:hypothetical protein
LRLWPAAVDLARLEQEALAIALRYAAGAMGEMFAVPDPKKVL